MAEKFEYLKKKLKKHKVFNFMKQYLTVNEIRDIKRQMWENLESKQYLLIYVRATKSYTAIFKHLDNDEADKEAGGHPLEEKFDEKAESFTEIDFFSSDGVSEDDAKILRKKDPSVYFGFNPKKWQKKSKTLNAEDEIIFIILTRLFNFDLHFEEIVHEINNSNKTEKKEYIK